MTKGAKNIGFKFLVESKLFTLIIAYILFGSFLFSSKYANSTYIYIFSSVITNSNYLLIFLFPPVILIVMMCFNFYNGNTNIILKYQNKKNLFYEILTTSLFLLLYYYFVCLISIAITTNIVPHGNMIDTHFFDYTVPDIFIMIVYIVKICLFLVVLVSIILLSMYKIKNMKNIVFLILVFLVFINMSKYIVFPEKINFLNPSIHIYNFTYTKVFFKIIFPSLWIYMFVISCFYFILRFIGINIGNIEEISNE